MNLDNHSYLDNQIKNYIYQLTSGRKDFDEGMFEDWLIRVGIANKINPTRYIKSCFAIELEKGTFKPLPQKRIKVNVLGLFNSFRQKGIYVPSDEEMFVDVTYNHLVNDKHIDFSALSDLHDKILDYMKTLEFSEYKTLLMSCKFLRPYKVDWKMIEAAANRATEEWNKLFPEEKMTYEQEQWLKVTVRANDCDDCLKRMQEENPNMLDCPFRHNNDEHLCKHAEKYKEWEEYKKLLDSDDELLQDSEGNL